MSALSEFEDALHRLVVCTEDGEIDDAFRQRIRRAVNRLAKFKNEIKEFGGSAQTPPPI